ncbi:MAG: energy transducer TonB [Thiohalocapsa sp.]|nr:energy transducer TonB [Thiohalocapsa sp.]
MSSAAQRSAEYRYLKELQRAISRRRYYPNAARRSGLEGTAKVQFTIASDGGFSGIGVSVSSGSRELDDAALTTIRRLGRFKPIPLKVGRNRWTVRVPIVYRLN